MTKLKKILVIQTSFIGDVILATSLLETLRANHAEAQIDVLVRKGSESIFEGHPFVGNVIVWNKKKGKYAALFQTIKEVRSQHYELIVNPHRFGSSGLICAFSGATTTVGFKKNPFHFWFSHSYQHAFDGRHEIERNHGLIEAVVDQKKPSLPRLYPQQHDFDQVHPLKQTPYRCLAPTSVWFTKQWPAEKWIELIDALPPSETIYLLGAPADRAQCESIAKRSSHPGIKTLAGSLSLLQSAALMKDAVMNYVNDSAPMHLCSAVNAPTTVVYCSTIPAFGFGPLSANARIIEIQETLECRPCGLHGHHACPKGYFQCAHSIHLSQFEF